MVISKKGKRDYCAEWQILKHHAVKLYPMSLEKQRDFIKSVREYRHKYRHTRIKKELKQKL